MENASGGLSLLQWFMEFVWRKYKKYPNMIDEDWDILGKRNLDVFVYA